MVTQHELWYRYVPESGNWHDGTCTRKIEAFSAATCTPLFGAGLMEAIPDNDIDETIHRDGSEWSEIKLLIGVAAMTAAIAPSPPDSSPPA